jgi:hypothetical protein
LVFQIAVFQIAVGFDVPPGFDSPTAHTWYALFIDHTGTRLSNSRSSLASREEGVMRIGRHGKRGAAAADVNGSW